MTNLTEQLKKGELLAGWYYVKKVNGQQDIAECYKVTDVITNVSRTMFEFSEDIEQVLAPVEPSYEEWAKLKERLKKTQELELEVRRENTKLKELLKECRDEIEYLQKHYKGNIDHFKNNTRLDKEINRVLREDK